MVDLSGVVDLVYPGHSQASGVLLADRRHILTVAHFLDDLSRLEDLQLNFNIPNQDITVTVSSLITHPGWQQNSDNYNHDLGIIELSQPINSSAIQGYQLYRQFDEVGQIMTKAGFSETIDPETGRVLDQHKSLHSGTNRYDTTTDAINPLFHSSIATAMQLSYDFDNGEQQHDAYGRLLGIQDVGTGNSEVFSNLGDSGGPAFIDGKIAGLASFIFRYDVGGITADITSQQDSSYGEMASDTRVSKYAPWIDQIINPNAQSIIPTTLEQVDRYPVEGSQGLTINYFLLQLSAPLMIDSQVDFETLDGSAHAGSDFVYTQGQVSIAKGQTTVAIPVEIIADSIPETDETFQLKVSHPVGAAFPAGVDALYAQHTIIDDDHIFIVGQPSMTAVS